MRIWDKLMCHLYALVHIKAYQERVLTAIVILATGGGVIFTVSQIIRGIKVSPFTLFVTAISAAVLITAIILLVKGEWYESV